MNEYIFFQCLEYDDTSYTDVHDETIMMNRQKNNMNVNDVSNDEDPLTEESYDCTICRCVRYEYEFTIVIFVIILFHFK